MNATSTPQSGVVLPLSDLRRRLAFAVILAAAFCTCLVFTVIPPILPELAKQFGGGRSGELSAQMALTMPSLGWLIGGAVSGWLVSRTGLRAAIVGSLLALGLFGGVGGVLPDLIAFGASRFALGFACAFLITGSATLLANIYDDRSRPTMVGYMKGMASGAAIPISLATGVMAQGLGWRAPFALYVVFGVAAAVFAFFATPADPPRLAKAQVPKAEAGTVVRLLPVLALVFLLHLLPMLSITQMPFVLAEQGVTSKTTISAVMASSGLIMSIGAIGSGYLQAKFGSWSILVLGLLLAGGGYALLGVAPTWQVVAAANGLAILGCGLYFPHYLTLPLSRVTPSGRALAIGLYQAAMYLSAFINPLFFKPFRDQFGLGGGFVAVGILTLVVTVGGVAWAMMRGAGRARAARATAS